MLDMLNQFLVGNASSELADSIKAAYEGLERMGVEELDTTFEAILMMDNSVDTGTTIVSVTETLKALQHNTLAEYAVILDWDTPMPLVTMMLDAILLIEDYEDTEAILRICLSEMQPDEAFVEIIALVSHKNADELLPHIEDIGPALLRRIADIVSATDDEVITDEDRIQRAHYVHMLNRFMHYLGSKNLLIVGMLKDGLTVGYPYAIYSDTVGRDFEGTIPEQIAKDMIAMALVSSDGSANPRAVIKPCLERYIADMNTITRVDIEVNRLLQGFSHE